MCLSAGHVPGVDPGACSGGLQEADLNVKIVKMGAEVLRKHGVGVLEVPDTLTLNQSITWVNERKDQIDLVVDVHCNAGGGSGVESWHYDNRNGEGKESAKLAQFLVDALAVETLLANRGIHDETTNRWGRLGIVHNTVPLAALVECGFIDNETDRKLLKSDDGLFRFAKGLARGILGYLGLPWSPELLSPSANTVGSPVPVQPQQNVSEEIKRELEKLSQQLNENQNRLFDTMAKVKTIEEKLLNIKTII